MSTEVRRELKVIPAEVNMFAMSTVAATASAMASRRRSSRRRCLVPSSRAALPRLLAWRTS
ncbi:MULTISPECIES: hypothetical protein [Paenibacillus]